MSYDVQLTEVPSQPTAVVRGHVDDASRIGEFLGRAYGQVHTTLAPTGVQASGPPFGRYRPTDDGGFDIEAGVPTSEVITSTGAVLAAELPGGPCATTTHTGAYDGVGQAYQAVLDWLAQNGRVPADTPWESYLDDPEVTQPRTAVYIPCQRA